MKKLLLLLLLPFAQPALAAEDALKECRQIEALEERVACYDAFVDSQSIEQIAATVTDVRESADKKLIVSLDNGHVWRQLDNKSLHLGNGEAVIVRKASLGSYRLEKASGSRSIRVKRAD